MNNISQRDVEKGTSAKNSGNICSTCRTGLQVFYISLLVLRFISFVIFFGYDHKCAVFEKASITKCTQEFLLPHPEYWSLAWLGISLTCDVLFIFILYLYCGSKNLKLWHWKKMWKNGTFWSFNILCIAPITIFLWRLIEHGLSAINLLYLFLSPVTLLVVYSLNYIRRPPFQLSCENCRSCCCSCCERMYTHPVVYWLTLVMYIFESFGTVVVVTLEVLLEIAPLSGTEPPRNAEAHAIQLMLMSAVVIFNNNLLSFFWYKFFHGNEDFFSDQREKLEEILPEQGIGNGSFQNSVDRDPIGRKDSSVQVSGSVSIERNCSIVEAIPVDSDGEDCSFVTASSADSDGGRYSVRAATNTDSDGGDRSIATASSADSDVEYHCVIG